MKYLAQKLTKITNSTMTPDLTHLPPLPSPMPPLDNPQQQTWVPYETTKDCSQGFCSIYCPQWCYIIFPPPPPFSLEDDSSGPTFSPLVIAIIGILASAFLLVSYYTIISKYCGSFGSFRRRIHRAPGPDGPDLDDDPAAQSRRHDAWIITPSNGLDEALISKIAVCKYKRGDGFVDGTDCSVCLGEFRDDETLRLLPKCSHAFHLHCIDTWLKSHSNCPLCRANIVLPNPPLPQLPAALPAPESGQLPESEHNDEMVVVVIDDLDTAGEEDGELGNDGDASKDPSQVLCDSDAIIEIRDNGAEPIRRSFSMDSLHRGRVSIADVLRMSMEDEYLAAKDHGILIGVGSSRGNAGEHSKSSGRSRSLHCVMSPVPMKRSVSSGRFCFTRNGRGKNAVLPI